MTDASTRHSTLRQRIEKGIGVYEHEHRFTQAAVADARLALSELIEQLEAFEVAAGELVDALAVGADGPITKSEWRRIRLARAALRDLLPGSFPAKRDEA